MDKTISPVIIELLRTCFGGVNVEILDTEMQQKFPDSYAVNGYWGVDISVSAGVINEGGKHNVSFDKKHKVFLKYQLAEDILIHPYVKDQFVYDVLIDDLSQMERKIKLQKISEMNESKLNNQDS